MDRDLSECGDIFIRHKDEVTILEKVRSEKSFLEVYPRKPFGLPTTEKPTASGDIRLRYNGGTGTYSDKKVKVNANLIGKWKVITSRLTVEHAGETDKNGMKRIISTLEVLKPNVVCSETYLLLAAFDTENEAANFMAYMKTCFVRCLIAMVTATQQLARSNFRFIPLQDFTRSWSDADLYKKYGLTDEEIKFIESTIKPMK